jgi:hypothetical protein
MDKLLAISAKVIIGYSFYEMYNYYILKQLEHKIKSAISIDMSYEKIPENLIDKNTLIATSITKIKHGLDNYTLTKDIEESGVRDNITTLKIDKDFLRLSGIELEKPNKRVYVIDPPILKSQLIDKEIKLTPFQAIRKAIISR